MTGQGKLLIITGAPDSSRLDWSPSSLLTTFQPSIAQFALLQSPVLPSLTPNSSIHPDQAVWRSLPLNRTHIRTGFTQQHDLNLVGAFPSSTDFLNTVAISFAAASQGLSQEDADEESSRLIADFYEHSLALHGDLASSQLVPHPDSQQPRATNTVSFDTNGEASLVSEGPSTVLEDSMTTTFADATLKAPLHPTRDHLSDLEDIPPAAYLLSILPATMTVTLIAGVISIAAPREITTHYGAVKTLVEVLVGDETKSGFSVTFWLSSGGQGGGDNAADEVLRSLRNQDVVLLQNVALNVFRKKVYGGSLRRGMTRVGLLYRGRMLGEGDVGGYYDGRDLSRAGKGEGVHPQLEKTRRVRDWVLKFVGGGAGAGAGEKGGSRTRKSKERDAPRQWNQPPPLDSQ